jgi:hypothetical protein
MEQDHKIHPGTECSHCGLHHKIIESLPERPLTEEEVNSLNKGESLVLAEPINLLRGELMPGFESSDWTTEDIVIATDSAAKVLSLHEGHGWVVDVEAPLDCDCCTPKEHGENVLLDASEMLKESVDTVMGDDPIASDEDLVRWAIDE